jgi:hypothetical protein
VRRELEHGGAARLEEQQPDPKPRDHFAAAIDAQLYALSVIGVLASVAGLRRAVTVDPARAFGGP